MTAIYQMLTHILAGGGMGEVKSPISPSLKAYCLDGDDFKGDNSKNLPMIAGLGACSCCDYFCPTDDCVILIEETQLIAKKNNLKETYGADVKIISEEIRKENYLKVYGSLLVLCRLKSQCATVNNMVKDKPYKFYLIASDGTLQDSMFMGGVQSKLSGIMGALKIIEDVIVCSPDEFKRKFPHLPPTNINQAP